LTPLWNMPGVGWAQDVLFRDGKYRTDFLKPGCDCVELMSWWEWSPLGPQCVPLDQFADKMGPAKMKGWKSYFAKDPVTGALMFNNNPGDYDGYNERFGGLPALREGLPRLPAIAAGGLCADGDEPERITRMYRPESGGGLSEPMDGGLRPAERIIKGVAHRGHP